MAYTEIKSINGRKLCDDEARRQLAEVPATINTALEQAKESGQFDGKDGADGHTPVKGTDYFTDADKEEIIGGIFAQVIDGSEVSY